MNNYPTLTSTDLNAITLNDSNYINNKGAKLYTPESYSQSVEYYRLAAAMGNVQAISNLGYCYLYGRGIESSTSLAIGYFRAAALRGNVDAAYKLGDIYSRDKWGCRDTEAALYYYNMAASFISDTDWNVPFAILNNSEYSRYPSLCYALGREMGPGGSMNTNLDISCQFLLQARTGYARELENGAEFYRGSFCGVLNLLDNDAYNAVRAKYDFPYDNDPGCDTVTGVLS